MGMFFYTIGTKHFSKDMGCVGRPETCSFCGKTYKKKLIKITEWGTFDYIPIIPKGVKYFCECPICARGHELSKEQGKALLAEIPDPTLQDLTVYAKHYAAEKEKGFLATDTAYELWIHDGLIGKDYLLSPKGETTKETIKQEKKARGLKKIEIIEE